MSETKGATMSETAVERRLREMAAQIRHDHANEDSVGAAEIDAGREAIATLKKLTNEVTAMLAMAEEEMRQAAGHTNLEVLKYHHEGACALLARCEGEK